MSKALMFSPVERIFWWRSCSFWRRCCRRAWWLLLTLVSIATDRGTGPRSWAGKPWMTADTPPASTCFSWSPKAAWQMIERILSFFFFSWITCKSFKYTLIKTSVCALINKGLCGMVLNFSDQNVCIAKYRQLYPYLFNFLGKEQ